MADDLGDASRSQATEATAPATEATQPTPTPPSTTVPNVSTTKTTTAPAGAPKTSSPPTSSPSDRQEVMQEIQQRLQQRIKSKEAGSQSQSNANNSLAQAAEESRRRSTALDQQMQQYLQSMGAAVASSHSKPKAQSAVVSADMEQKMRAQQDQLRKLQQQFVQQQQAAKSSNLHMLSGASTSTASSTAPKPSTNTASSSQVQTKKPPVKKPIKSRGEHMETLVRALARLHHAKNEIHVGTALNELTAWLQLCYDRDLLALAQRDVRDIGSAKRAELQAQQKWPSDLQSKFDYIQNRLAQLLSAAKIPGVSTAEEEKRQSNIAALYSSMKTQAMQSGLGIGKKRPVASDTSVANKQTKVESTKPLTTQQIKQQFDVDLSARTCKVDEEGEPKLYFAPQCISKVMQKALIPIDTKETDVNTQEQSNDRCKGGKKEGKRRLKSSIKIDDDAIACMQECVTEFLLFATSEAQDEAEVADDAVTRTAKTQGKKTSIAGPHIIQSMDNLGFSAYAQMLHKYHDKVKRVIDIGAREKYVRRAKKVQELESAKRANHQAMMQNVKPPSSVQENTVNGNAKPNV